MRFGLSATEMSAATPAGRRDRSRLAGARRRNRLCGRPRHLEALEDRVLLSAINTANITWSRYFGGSGNEGPGGSEGLAIDASGNKLLGGWTESSDLPAATNSFSGAGGVDGYVAKFDSSGNLLWSTYLNMGDTTEIEGIALDSAGDTLAAGRGGDHAFLAKVDPNGNVLWTLSLGGSGSDRAASIAVDGSGNAYVTGYTLSTDFGGATGSNAGGRDVFIAKVDANGALQWAEYFGGSGDDSAGSIAVNASGELLLSGVTTSTNLPDANNAYHGGPNDAFMAKFDPSGTPQWSTYIGGSGNDGFPVSGTSLATALAWDTDGTAVMTGYTSSPNLSLAQNKFVSGGDGYVCKVDSTGSLLWSSYLGGSPIDAGISVTLDGGHNVLVAGASSLTSVNGTTMNCLVAKLSPSGAVDWINQFGGSKDEYAGAMVLDAKGNAWIAGSTWSNDLPAAVNAAPGGVSAPGEPHDTFLAKIGASALSQPARLSISTLPASLSAGALPTITVQAQYASGSLVTDGSPTVTLALVSNNGATLSGTTSVQAINGVATFSDLSIDAAGSYKLQFISGALSASLPKPLMVTADTASAHLVLVQQPGATTVGLSLAPVLTLDVKDQFGNLITTDRSKVTLGIVRGPGGALGGTTTVPVNKGVAACTKLSLSMAGTYTLAAADSSLADVTPVQFTQVIGQATTTGVAPHPAASYTFGQPINLTTTFKSNAPSSVPLTGSAVIVDSSQNILGTASLAANGLARFALIGVAAGTRVCTLSYGGDVNHTPFTTSTFTLTIKPAATKTTLQSSALQITSGQPLMLTASVGSTGPSSTPRTGTVTFLDGTTPLGTVTLTASATASLTFIPSAGVHKYSAAYSGDANFLASSGIGKPATVTLSPVSIAGQTIWIADLAGTSGHGPPGIDVDTVAATGTALTAMNFVENQTFTYVYNYRQTGATTGTVLATFRQGSTTVTITALLSFTTPTSGNAHLAFSSKGGFDASFVLLGNPVPSYAPVAVAGAVITLNATAGGGQFASSGSTLLSPAPTGNTYTLQGISGSSVSSSGTYNYSLIDPAVVAFAYSDSSSGTGTLYLAFTSSSGGVYYNVDANGDWQAGTFAL